MRPRARRYKYTAEECVDMVIACPSFNNLPSRREMIAWAEADIFLAKKNIAFVHDDNGLIDLGDGFYERYYCFGKKIIEITYYEIDAFCRRVISEYGNICNLCKCAHFTSRYDVHSLIGSRSTNFLEDFERGELITPPPICLLCAQRGSRAIWGKGKGIYLSGIENPTLDQIELATLQWIADELNRVQRLESKLRVTGGSAA